ncbi:MAG: hypothetical protein QOH06_5875 [Acidobacteriota bacterium]|jgi:hypothetical protein|nr:hypothetical protein [Acidobacteriota bacterium]
MSEKEPEKEEKQISPYRGWIELMQVGSVVLIPVGWLLRSSSASAAVWSLAAVLALLPFYMAFRHGKARAEAEDARKKAAENVRVEAAAKAKAEEVMARMVITEVALSMVVAEVEEVALRNAEKREPGRGVESAPYHSSRAGTKVYHIFSDCFLGNDIEKKYWTGGMGDKTLCDRCEEMMREKEAAA